MKKLKNTPFTKVKIIGLLGLVAVLFIFVTVRANYLPLGEDNAKSMAAYPPPVSTPVITIIPTDSLAPTQSPKIEPSITPTPVVLDDGWFLYTDPDSEFTFAYPPTARIDAGKNPLDLSKNISIQFKLPDKPYQGMSIRLELNPKRLQGSEIANQLFEMSAQKQAPVGFSNSFKPFTVGKASAIEASIPSLNTETTVIVPFGDKVFILSPVHDSVNTKVEKETLELFYKILTTFTFNISK